MTVHFGFAETGITPNGPVTLGGYAARDGESEGVADPLRAQVLSFREDDRRFVLVVLDLLALTRGESDLLSERLATLTSLEPEVFEFACTHTHSAPNVIDSSLIGNAPVEREYLDVLPERLAVAVRSAIDSEGPLEAGWSRGEVEGVGASRTSRNGSAAIAATVLSLNDVCVVEFACHPTVLGQGNLLVSADLFGAARRELSQRLGGAPVVFLQGASADVSTRLTRRSQSVDEVRRLGGLLADAAREIHGRTQPEPVSGLSAGRTSVELPRKEGAVSEGRLRGAEIFLDRARKTASHDEIRRAQTKLEGLRIEARIAGTKDVGSSCPVFLVRVGGIALTGIGGELPLGLGCELSGRSPLRPTVVLGCAGGYVGYLMAREAEPESYEALASPYEAGAGNMVVQAALEMIREVT